MRHNVVIFAKHDSSIVVPPGVLVQGGDEITFHAIGQPVTLLFPPGTPLDYPPGPGGWIVIPVEPGRPVTVTVQAGAALERYPYAVWCDSEDPRFRSFAKGNSDPEIIVYG